jgi:hypothetical protein
MNIFFLDNDPQLAAIYHGDKHVVKMILESAQLLSTAHHVLDGDKEGLYKKTHMNHPCAIWTRESSHNYLWLLSLLKHLCDEYTFRYKKIHKTSQLIPALNELPSSIKNTTFTKPAQAMPEEFKNENSVVAYRNYYREKIKQNIAQWRKTREAPLWIGDDYAII